MAETFPCRYCRIEGKRKIFESFKKLEIHVKSAHALKVSQLKSGYFVYDNLSALEVTD